MGKEIVVPEKGSELYNGLLEIFEGNDDELDTGLGFAEQKIEELVEEITDDLDDAFIREDYWDSYIYCLWILLQLNPQFRTIKIKESLVYEKIELDLEDSILISIYDHFVDDYSYSYYVRFAKIVELIEKQDTYELTNFETDLHDSLLYHLELYRSPVWGWGKEEEVNKKMWCQEIARDNTRAVWNHMYVKSQRENKKLNEKINSMQHERITEQKGEKQLEMEQTLQKTALDKNELTDAKKKEIVKVSIQFVIDHQDVNGNNTFNEQQQWEGVYATLVRCNYCASIPNEFPSYLDSLELDFSKAKVKRPCKNFTRYGITKMLINDGVWALDNKKTESSIRLVYELFNKKLAEELEKRKPKIEK